MLLRHFYVLFKIVDVVCYALNHTQNAALNFIFNLTMFEIK